MMNRPDRVVLSVAACRWYLSLFAFVVLEACGGDAIPPSASDMHVPPPSHCANGKQDADESDVDCGGFACAACADGRHCNDASDCASAACTNGSCAGSSCKDGTKNGMETDSDCGGAVCPACAEGKMCIQGSDCQSADCNNGRCAPPGAPTCQDVLQNGFETDVDCGGANCPGCADGKKCVLSADCLSLMCSGGMCVRPPPGTLAFSNPIATNADLPGEFAVGDITGDGKVDFAVLDLMARDAVPFLGDGKGMFAPKNHVGMMMRDATQPFLIDWDGDKKLDLMLIGSGLLSYFKGAGDGTFALVDSQFVPLNKRFAAADFNKDGRSDLLYVYSNPNQMDTIAYLNRGDGSLNAMQYSKTNCNQPGLVIVADLTGLHRSDLVVACSGLQGLNSYAAMLGHGDGTFDAGMPSQLPKSYLSMVAVDLTADGKVDLVWLLDNDISVMAGNGDGTFKAPAAIPLANGPFANIMAADFNRDGRLDLVATGQSNPKMSIFPGVPGGLGMPVTVPLPPNSSIGGLAAVEVNGDGKPDIVVTSAQAGKILVVINASN